MVWHTVVWHGMVWYCELFIHVNDARVKMIGCTPGDDIRNILFHIYIYGVLNYAEWLINERVIKSFCGTSYVSDKIIKMRICICQPNYFMVYWSIFSINGWGVHYHELKVMRARSSYRKITFSQMLICTRSNVACRSCTNTISVQTLWTRQSGISFSLYIYPPFSKTFTYGKVISRATCKFHSQRIKYKHIVHQSAIYIRFWRVNCLDNIEVLTTIGKKITKVQLSPLTMYF